jgi:hypothetical protein
MVVGKKVVKLVQLTLKFLGINKSTTELGHNTTEERKISLYVCERFSKKPYERYHLGNIQRVDNEKKS